MGFLEVWVRDDANGCDVVAACLVFLVLSVEGEVPNWPSYEGMLALSFS